MAKKIYQLGFFGDGDARLADGEDAESSILVAITPEFPKSAIPRSVETRWDLPTPSVVVSLIHDQCCSHFSFDLRDPATASRLEACRERGVLSVYLWDCAQGLYRHNIVLEENPDMYLDDGGMPYGDIAVPREMDEFFRGMFDAAEGPFLHERWVEVSSDARQHEHEIDAILALRNVLRFRKI